MSISLETLRQLENRGHMCLLAFSYTIAYCKLHFIRRAGLCELTKRAFKIECLPACSRSSK